MEVYLTIQLGVLSGIITAVILKLFYEVVQKIVIPWFESLVYKGVIVQGEWESKLNMSPTGFYVQLKLEIDQNGHKLSGNLFASYMNPSGVLTQMKHLKVEGLISDLYISLHFSPKSRKNISLGNYLLQVRNSGDTLSGKMTSLDNTKMEIVTYNDVEWKRIK